MEVLSTKHPEARTPTAAILESYPERPTEIVPVDITDNMVTAVDCWRLHIMAEQWAAPMGRLLRHYERLADHTGQAARDQTGRRWRNLETADGKVPFGGKRQRLPAGRTNWTGEWKQV